jgi:uncharacterized tellurite resistance protein B-like protein
MRHYPSDSPEALGRIVALALMADGAIDPSELRLLEAEKTISRLGLDPNGFDRVFHEFCADMLGTAQRLSSGQLELDAETIDLLLDEVSQPQLRAATLRTMLDIVHADEQLACGEAVLVTRAMQRWSLDLHQVYLLAARGRPALPGAAISAAHA